MIIPVYFLVYTSLLTRDPCDGAILKPRGKTYYNYGREPLDDVTYQKRYSLVFVISDKKVFENCIFEPYFLPGDLLLQSTETILANFWRVKQGSLCLVLSNLTKLIRSKSHLKLFLYNSI